MSLTYLLLGSVIHCRSAKRADFALSVWNRSFINLNGAKIASNDPKKRGFQNQDSTVDVSTHFIQERG